MSLFRSALTPCRRMVEQRTADGEGGFLTTWTEGVEFSAAITLERAGEATSDPARRPKNIYNVLTRTDTQLHYHDVFRRMSDGKTFRVNCESTQRRTPERAAFQAVWVTAEDWEVT